MVQAAVPLQAMSGSARLAKARERFLAAESVGLKEVREPILASWRRSRDWSVAADRIDLRYTRDPDPETMLARSADPVLRTLHEQLDGQPISIILTDSNGLVLSRLTADRDLERHLDGVMLAPGFNYSEDLVGTNGIGTALEAGRATHVFGHEHYAEHLEGLACAGVPIHHPITGKTVGVIDLTCWRKNADPLLVALVKNTADQITSSLLNGTSGREFNLLEEYVRACRRTGGIVLAIGNDVVMMNDYARRILDPSDQAALIGQAAEVLTRRSTGAVTADLPTGLRARMYCRPVDTDTPYADGIVHVKLLETVPRPTATASGKQGAKASMFLPGLVGSGVLWTRACREAEVAYDSAEWLTLEGEPGVGKMALARAVHQRRNPAGRFHVIDAASAKGNDWLATARSELLDSEGMLVIRHVDELNVKQVHALSSALQEARAARRHRTLRVAVTLNRKDTRADLTKLLRFFPATVELPPLRHHIEDLQELVPFFLARLSQHGRVVCSPEAMQLLLRSSWPGNAGQLWQVLRKVVQRRRAGSIQPSDLPPECWTVSRRLLSPLESMERDAIVQSLLDCDGNKVKAAEALGMSRATIYRKIHEYGIVTPGPAASTAS
ncbi:MAG TPA: GAF domain-containing protein [Streptosporangiaceae bacterium]|jgi:transcriptional regulator of acetoin/glycerol metabolism|nr:GAF domain-containing protein [Streptosporangiaceae bacterium]